MTKGEIIQGLYRGDNRAVKEAIKALEQQSIAEERYQDLVEHFGDKAIAKCILEDREEFKKWLERIKWNVRKVDELARKLVKQPSEDCVSKEQLKRELHAQMAVDAITKETAEDMLNHLPPVTPTHGTCKDCKHWDKDDKYCKHLSSEYGWFEDDDYRVVTEEDFYCANFEKRGDEDGSN